MKLKNTLPSYARGISFTLEWKPLWLTCHLFKVPFFFIVSCKGLSFKLFIFTFSSLWLRSAWHVFLPCETVYHIQLFRLAITINYLLKVQSEIVVGKQIIIDISRFFNSTLKKRDLSNQSCNGEEPKKAREGSLNDSSVSWQCFLLKVWSHLSVYKVLSIVWKILKLK